jgi:hypothetical protein
MMSAVTKSTKLPNKKNVAMVKSVLDKEGHTNNITTERWQRIRDGGKKNDGTSGVSVNGNFFPRIGLQIQNRPRVLEKFL